jgi:hypothetical protein
MILDFLQLMWVVGGISASAIIGAFVGLLVLPDREFFNIIGFFGGAIVGACVWIAYVIS